MDIESGASRSQFVFLFGCGDLRLHLGRMGLVAVVDR